MENLQQIRLLSDTVANQIAAGEVVERPASVLKELLENALDAGGRVLEVAVTAAGRRAIVVSDDGAGMTREDALLSIERHATSKIREAEDLQRVATLGFRGEALAAIASVSRLTLTTRRREALAGAEVTVVGGKLLDVRETGCPAGTSVAVRNLFFNVPARRRFLRTDATEYAHIRQTFLTYALGHPEAAMSLTADGDPVWNLGAGESLAERLGALFDAETVESLATVRHEANGVSVTGRIGRPRLHRPDRSVQFFFINGRPAGAPVLAYALRAAYGEYLPRDRHPVVFLFLETDPALVDVNIHPAKREVKFRRSGAVRDAVIEALALALTERVGEAAAKGTSGGPFPERKHPAPPPPIFDYPRLSFDSRPAPGDAEDEGLGTDSTRSGMGPWLTCRLIGRAGDTYAVLETEAGVVFMDPRAAFERVLYERLIAQARAGQTASQRLLDPETIELSPREASRVRRNLEVLRRLGFGIAEFGGDAFLLDAVPSCLGDCPVREVLLDAAHAAAAAPASKTDWTTDLVARSACRAAAAGRGRLSDTELHRLIDDLAKAEMPYTCPHGRPTLFFIGFRDLDRKFGRI